MGNIKKKLNNDTAKAVKQQIKEMEEERNNIKLLKEMEIKERVRKLKEAEELEKLNSIKKMKDLQSKRAEIRKEYEQYQEKKNQ